MAGIRAFRFLAAMALAVAATLACAFPALAADIEVWGAQTYLSEADAADANINLVFMSGAAGDALYLNAADGSKALAQYLPHELGEGAQAGESVADVFTVHVGALDEAKLKDGSYTVEAWTKRGGTQLFAGSVYGVWARLGSPNADGDGGEGDGSGEGDEPPAEQETLLIGTRTVSDGGSFDFVPPNVVYAGGKAYELASQTPDVQDNLAYYDYQPFDPDGTVDGQVNYVDKDGSLLKSETFPVPTDGSAKAHQIPATIDADNGKRYRTLAYTDSVTAAYPGQTSFTVQCLYMRGAPYLATIRMVDGDGKVLATDTVNVDDKYAYVVPTVIYKHEEADGEMRAVAYNLADEEVWQLDATADLDQVVNHERTITVKYQRQSLEDGAVEVTFNQLDGQANPDVGGRTLGVQTSVVTKDNPQAAPDQQIEVDGVTYELASDASAYTYTYGSGKIPVVDAYYVPEGYSAPAPYQVNVNYVNIATSEVVKTQSFESTADPAIVDIDSPARFDVGDTTYVRLPGQSQGMEHNFYSGMDTYTVYYRDSNDTLNEGVVVERTRVITRTGGGSENAPGAGGAGAAGAGGVGAGAAGVAGIPSVTIGGNQDYVAVGGTGDGTLVNQRGEDTNAERIGDDETPLADGTGVGTVPTDEGGIVAGGIAAGVVLAIAAVAALLWWLLVARRRRASDEA